MSYEIPRWAGKPPIGLHLDVLKEDKLVQKLMIDEKKCYLFGRNAQMNDVCIDHQSCSRVHAAFVYHKHLNIAYLVDLGSTHGTFIGNLRIEANKPTQLQMNSQFHFGASTRNYILRERPTASRTSNIMEDIPMSEVTEGLLGLPESQPELDNLTEYNTAHNRRISMLGIAEDTSFKRNSKSKRKRRSIQFNEDEIIINPEDVDPSVGRFRNLINSTVIPTKRFKMENSIGIPTTSESSKHYHSTSFMPQLLYQGLPPSSVDSYKMDLGGGSTDVDMETPSLMSNLGSKLGLLLPNPAPEVVPTNDNLSTKSVSYNTSGGHGSGKNEENLEDGPKKKKYAKEAWPGRKPLLSGL